MPSLPSYRISQAQIKDMGVGIYATRPIRIGELVISEKPLIRSKERANLTERTAAIESLDHEDRAIFFALKNSYPSSPTVTGIFNTNSIPTGNITGDELRAVFPIISHFNHSCVSNAQYSWHKPSASERVYATADIPEGAEIYVSYTGGDEIDRRSKRQERFRKIFLFSCQCPECSGLLDAASEDRRERISALSQDIARAIDAVGELDVVQTARWGKERLRLRDTEKLYDCIGRGMDHQLICLLAALLMDQDTATRHASLSDAFLTLSYGVDGEKTTRQSQERADNFNQDYWADRTKMAMALPAICDACGKEEVGGFLNENSKGVDCGECYCAIYCSTSCKAAHRRHHQAVCDVLMGKGWKAEEEQNDQGEEADYEGILKEGWVSWRWV